MMSFEDEKIRPQATVNGGDEGMSVTQFHLQPAQAQIFPDERERVSVDAVVEEDLFSQLIL